MIVCPNCNHQNPDGAVQCEACYTPLPAMTTCPTCGTSVQADASFCGQCGTNLRTVAPVPATAVGKSPAPDLDIPDLVAPDPLVSPDLMPIGSEPERYPDPATPDPVAPDPIAPDPVAPPPVVPPPDVAVAPVNRTQLQVPTARLLHVQTNSTIELPGNLAVIHIGKPNDRIPPDIDVSGFPDSEIVSRIHADIRVEGGIYYIEDVGSSNGTYVNNAPLPMGNRHRLRAGDRIALGKGDRVTFLFQT